MRILSGFMAAIIATMGNGWVAHEPVSTNEIRAMASAQHDSAISLFRSFLSQPNDATYPEDIKRLVEWMEPQFEARGFATQSIETAGSPALFAERRFPGATKTALVYLQADGQPVDRASWDQPDPFGPVLKKETDGVWEIIDWPQSADDLNLDWRVFARSASDSKGPMTQFMVAMDAINAAEIDLHFNLKVIVDTEEELGSPNLAAAVKANQDLLAADFLLIFDGPPHASNKPTVTFGARGITTVTLTTYGPIVPQHSGHYGNFAPNPAFHLTRLLTSMKTADGRVKIKGFYDGVKISREVQQKLAAVPDNEVAILKGMGLAVADKVAPTLQEALQYPSLNIRGLAAAWVGREVRTIIPATAIAEIDIRTVKETDPERLVRLLRDHIETQGFYITDGAPSDDERAAYPLIVSMSSEVSYGAFRSDFESLPGLVARAGMKRLYDHEPILIRSFGGSIPIAPFVETLDIPAAIISTVNIDNNQHSPNENIRVGNFFEGIAVILAVLTSNVER